MLRRAGRLRAAAAVARARAASTTASPDRDRPGLYGLVGLHAPEDFARLTREATTTSTSLVASIAKDWSLGRLTRDGGGNGGAARVVTDLDEISDVVCAVVDVAEVCRNTHPDERWVRAAERAYIDLQQHVGNLNADRSLYDALRAADDGGASSSSSSSSSLPPEAARVASTLRHDFERGGVHLEGDARARLEDANSRVIRFGMAFQRNLADPIALGHVDVDRRALRGLPAAMAARMEPPPGADAAALSARIPLDASTLATTMRYVQSADARRVVYAAAHRGPEGNRDALRGLLDARAEAASLLGFESHAHYATSPLLAGDPDAARELMRTISDGVDDVARRELELMRRTLRGKWGDGGFGSGGGGGGRSAGSYSDGGGSYYSDHDAVRGWDRAYLIAAAKREACGVDANAVAQYFPIDKVLKGVAALLSRVFNVHLREVEMERGESWHEGVRKLRVAAGGGGAGEGEDVGTIYLDLTPRPRKFPHAAHFVIRCGKALKNQKPSVALVCSFGGGGGQGMGTRSTALLSHGEVETFLHELGHAMHSVLSKTKYQHLSGTRCAMDVVEIPSHVFEYFAWDADALKVISEHRSTGEALPGDFIHRMRRGKALFAATDLQQQCAYALTDLDAHSTSWDANMSDRNNMSDIVRQVASGYAAGVGHEPDADWELRFGHTVGYASTYYSYVYARCVAATVWGRFFEGDALARGAGESLRDGLLRHGGAVEPVEMLRNFLGADAVAEGSNGRGHAPCPARALQEIREGAAAAAAAWRGTATRA